MMEYSRFDFNFLEVDKKVSSLEDSFMIEFESFSDVLLLCATIMRQRDLVALPVRMGGLGLINPSDSADAEYSASIRA